MNDRRSLTAAELINALSELEPSTIITWNEHDSEWMRWIDWSIDSVSTGGNLRHGNIVDSGDDDEDEDEDDDG